MTDTFKKKPLSPSDIIIFGGTGDLCLRKILPALYYRLKEGQLPESSRIITLGRGAMSREEHLDSVKSACQQFIAAEDFNDEDWQRFFDRLSYLSLDATISEQYTPLKECIEDTPREVRIFYLSTPAHLFGTICQQLAQHQLITDTARVVLEKPIGHDLQSFNQINAHVLECFDEAQIYRIDHYLGKETVQNLVVLRFANNVFEHMWNSHVIDHVQITVSESTGLENRHDYYDDAGALRDMVQNHLLQLLCLIAMEPPNQVTPDTIRDEKLKVLRALRPATKHTADDDIVRAQYDNGKIDEQKVPSYCEEVGNPSSQTETYVALKAYVDNWRWSGIPFYLRTGKRMASRFSEIVIQFKNVPHAIFPNQMNDPASNKLVIRLQPEEYVKFQLVTKVPGPGGYRLKPVHLNLSLADEFEQRRPGAYERLLMDVVRGNPTLFMRSDEVEAAWQWIESIMDSWMQAGTITHHYTAGSMGPKEADELIAKNGRKWYQDD